MNTNVKTSPMKKIMAVAIMLVMLVSGIGLFAVNTNASAVGKTLVVLGMAESGRQSNITEDIQKHQGEYLKPAYDYNSGKWGYVNDYDEWVIAPQYEEAYDFHSEVARVRKDNGKYNYITKGGRECSFNDYDVAMDFNSNGTAFVKSNANNSSYSTINVYGNTSD